MSQLEREERIILRLLGVYFGVTILTIGTALVLMLVVFP